VDNPILYFAYGANLDCKAMRSRCRGCQPVTKARLIDHRLVFRGVADIEFAPGASLQGALYRITTAGLNALDRFESHPHFYDRKIVSVFNPEGIAAEAIVYQMVRQYGYAPPSDHYLNTILNGCREWEIEEEYIRKIIKAAAASHFGGY